LDTVQPATTTITIITIAIVLPMASSMVSRGVELWLLLPRASEGANAIMHVPDILGRCQSIRAGALGAILNHTPMMATTRVTRWMDATLMVRQAIALVVPSM